MMSNEKQCCRNCSNLVEFPRNNRYGDIDYLCRVTGYFASGIDRDVTKVKRYSPGGKELECRWVERGKGLISTTLSKS